MRVVDVFREIFLFVLLVLLQVLVFNHVTLFGVASPLIYVYFVIKLPFGRNRFYVILLSFLMGLIIDIFLNTPGVNAAAITIVATLRVIIAPLFYPKNELDIIVPSIRGNSGAFIKYTLTMVLLHHTLLFLIDALTLFDITKTVIRIGSSVLLTTILLLSIDSLFYRKGRIIG